jgi:hypothetical protein
VVVLVDHAREDLAAADRTVEGCDGRRVVVRWALAASLMGPMIIEVVGVPVVLAVSLRVSRTSQSNTRTMARYISRTTMNHDAWG